MTELEKRRQALFIAEKALVRAHMAELIKTDEYYLAIEAIDRMLQFSGKAAAEPVRTSAPEQNCCSCSHFGGWHDEELFYCKLHGEYYIKPNSICRKFTPTEGAAT